MICRLGCGACCIAPSISSPIPGTLGISGTLGMRGMRGMPDGKPAGVRCVQLTDDNLCAIFNHPERPEVCSRLRPAPEMCGTDNAAALATLTAWEQATKPA